MREMVRGGEPERGLVCEAVARDTAEGVDTTALPPPPPPPLLLTDKIEGEKEVMI